DRWKVGDAVTCGPDPTCGVCAGCRAGEPSQCEARGRPLGAKEPGAKADEEPARQPGHGAPGGFAPHTVVDARSLCAVPRGLDLRAAALAEPLAVALHAVTRAAIRPEQSTLVFGAGPIGAL